MTARLAGDSANVANSTLPALKLFGTSTSKPGSLLSCRIGKAGCVLVVMANWMRTPDSSLTPQAPSKGRTPVE